MLTLLPSAASGIDGLPVDYTPIDEGHVDFTFCYEDGLWNMGVIHESGGDPNNPAEGTPREGYLAPMILKDQLFTTGSRGTRETDPVWNFLGVGAGEAFWLVPQTQEAGVVFAGFSVCDIADSASYFESDARVNESGQWTTVTLRQVEYVGKKPGGGKLAMWSEDFIGAQPTVWMSTANGIDNTDKYFVQSGAHKHPNIGFSALGLYAMTFDLTFYEGPGKSNPNTSPMVTYYFAVGTYWEWIARHFDPTNWFLSQVIGETADPDRDGIPNLVEYACDLDPTTPGHREFSTTLGYGLPAITQSGAGAQFTFPQRLAGTNPQIVTSVEASTTLGAASWLPSSGITAAVPLRTDWQTATHSVSGTLPPSHFLRLKVVLQNEIPY